MNLASRTGAWAKSGAPLPYDAEVEYLEETGTQWIDTGLLCSGSDEVVITVYISTADKDGRWIYFGAGGNARVWATSGVCRFGEENLVTISEKIIFESWNTIVLNETHVVVNGETFNTSLGAFQGRSNLTSLIFRGNGMPTAVAPSLKIASFSWRRNGALTLDFIPVRVGNIGYMYDRVSGQLFGNQGTGAFVIGPDKTT